MNRNSRVIYPSMYDTVACKKHCTGFSLSDPAKNMCVQNKSIQNCVKNHSIHK